MLKSQRYKVEKEWMHSISLKTPTTKRQPIEEKKSKQWKTKRERAAQVNKEALTLFLIPTNPTP